MFSYAGDLERIFLVLREKVALRRIQARSSGGDGGASASAGAPEGGQVEPQAPQGEGTNRGQKRVATDDQSSPPKRPALN